MAAALAYYTIFALPPLLYLLLTFVTFCMTLAYEADEANAKARDLIATQAGQMIGNDSAADEISNILERNQNQSGAWWKTIISVLGILFGATGVVVAVQSSLNRVWGVQPDPKTRGIRNFLFKRMLSFAMIIGLGFLLLVSMVLSTILAALGSQVGQWVGLEETMVVAVNYLVVFLATLVIFAALLKFMPDAQIFLGSWLLLCLRVHDS